MRNRVWLGATLLWLSGAALEEASAQSRPATGPTSAPSTMAASRPSSRPADLDKLVIARPGTIPIILSVPHDGDLRLPVAARPKTKSRDLNMRPVAEALSKELEGLLNGKPYLVIARFQRKYIDANRGLPEAYADPAASPYYEAYHGALRTYVADCRRRWSGRAILIDLHGQVGGPAIYRGTHDGGTVRQLVKRHGMDSLNGPAGIFGVLESRGYSVYPPTSQPAGKEDTRYNGGFIVRTYGSQNADGIDAIQIEAPRSCRDGAEGQARFVKDLAAAVAAFHKRYLADSPATRPSTIPAQDHGP